MNTLNRLRLANYILTNLALAVLLWRALANEPHSSGAQNVFCFLAWLGCFASVGTSFSDSIKTKLALEGRTRPVPQDVAVFVDIAFVLVLVFFGWWWTMIATLLGLIASQSAWDDVERIQKDIAARATNQKETTP